MISWVPYSQQLPWLQWSVGNYSVSLSLSLRSLSTCFIPSVVSSSSLSERSVLSGSISATSARFYGRMSPSNRIGAKYSPTFCLPFGALEHVFSSRSPLGGWLSWYVAGVSFDKVAQVTCQHCLMEGDDSLLHTTHSCKPDADCQRLTPLVGHTSHTWSCPVCQWDLPLCPMHLAVL